MQGGSKIIYKELSYKIIGVMFEAYNELGYGHLEKVYCRAVEAGFKDKGLFYKKQVYY